MSGKIMCRMGDGERVLLPAEQIKEDILRGTQDAAERADIPALTDEDCPRRHLLTVTDLCAETLGIGITAVTARALSFFMRHDAP